jgi:hypothetical protein
MSEKEKKLISICEGIWEKRSKPNIWLDREDEPKNPSFLIYKRLDGLRAILYPFAHDKIRSNDLPLLSQKDFLKEITTLASSLNKSENFYPAPHTHTPVRQPDNYVDMAAHSILFGICALKLKLARAERASILNLIDKGFKCLTNEENYYQDKRVVAWAGTTNWAGVAQYQEERNVNFLSIYFSAQALGAIGEWVKFISGEKSKNNGDKNKAEELIKKGCRWILSRTHNHKSYEILSAEKKEAIPNELITTNTAALTVCFQLWDLLDGPEQTLTRKIAANFINYLKAYKPDDTEWYHLVPTQQAGLQVYHDRQDNYGIVTFLAIAKEKIGDQWTASIEELAGYFIEEYLHIKTNELLIGCLPWYVQDHMAALDTFSELHSDLTFSGSMLKKAIQVTLSDAGLVETITRSVLRNLNEAGRKAEFEKAEAKLHIAKQMRK